MGFKRVECGFNYGSTYLRRGIGESAVSHLGTMYRGSEGLRYEKLKLEVDMCAVMGQGPRAVANGVAGARRSIRRRSPPNVILTREPHPEYIGTKIAGHAMTLLWTRTHLYLKQTDVRLLFGRRLP
jgi:hypothetical protein